MANEIRKYRAALAQNDRNKPAYKILMLEVIIWSIVCGLGVGYIFDSDMVTCGAIGTFLVVFVLMIAIPDLRIIIYLFFGAGWATPFIFLGHYLGSFFYFVAFFVFLLSFALHSWGMTYLDDLTRSDDEV
jgi:hypothetical protein